MMIIFFLGFCSSLISMFLVRSHFLMCLLVLEFFLMFIYFFCMEFFDFFFFDFYFLVIYLVFGVCDGVLGLSLLVFLIRSSSSDYLDSLTLC